MFDLERVLQNTTIFHTNWLLFLSPVSRKMWLHYSAMCIHLLHYSEMCIHCQQRRDRLRICCCSMQIRTCKSCHCIPSNSHAGHKYRWTLFAIIQQLGIQKMEVLTGGSFLISELAGSLSIISLLLCVLFSGAFSIAKCAVWQPSVQTDTLHNILWEKNHKCLSCYMFRPGWALISSACIKKSSNYTGCTLKLS
jgi:hypothetical protein